MAYTWSSDLETGNATIDTQHKKLIQAINDLQTALKEGKGREKIRETLDFLLNYTVKHFTDEQNLQQKYGYPDYVNHKKLHDGFTATVKDLSDKINAQGPTISLMSQVNSNVGGWLVNNIKSEDVKVAKHIASKQ